MVTVQGKTGSVWEIKLKTHEEITFTTAVPRLSPAPDFSLQALLQAACCPLSTAGGPGSGPWFLPASPLFSLFSSALSWVLHRRWCLQESSAPERALHRLWWRSAPPWSTSSTTSSFSNPSVPRSVSGAFFLPPFSGVFFCAFFCIPRGAMTLVVVCIVVGLLAWDSPWPLLTEATPPLQPLLPAPCQGHPVPGVEFG